MLRQGQTAVGYKPALLDNGMRTMAPHIETGTRIIVSTEDALMLNGATRSPRSSA